jgi:hypothetical protein
MRIDLNRTQTLVVLLAVAFAANIVIVDRSHAAPILDPGDVFSFADADNCVADTEVPNLLDGLGGASSSCDAANQRVTAQVRPILGPGFVGFQTIRAYATITNDFEVSAEPETEGNTVAAWVTYDVNWDGRILLIGFLSKPSVELSIRLFDLTEGSKAIEGETIWARDDDAVGFSIPYVPVLSFNIGGGHDSNTVTSTFSAVLKRGHQYRIALRLECDVFSDGGLDIGTECDYEDNFPVGQSGGGAGWTRLSVKLGLDETATLEELESIREHTHLFLTGKGRGHNNTEAETGAAIYPDEPPVDDVDGVEASEDLCLATPESFEVDTHGCAIEEFWARNHPAAVCSRADWEDEESRNPQDCRWRSGSCELR